jgi:transposase, IS5 family
LRHFLGHLREDSPVRVPFSCQPTLDTLPISEVPLNTQGRDEIIPVLAALKHLHRQAKDRDEILTLVGQDVNATTTAHQGRKGLDYWQILVLAAVRLGCNFDYDKLQNLAEEHRTLRRMMGIGAWQDDHPEAESFDWRRLRDNVCLLRPETLKQLNTLVVRAGHCLVPEAAATVRGDTFVVETDIHYPTDANLLADGLRKIASVAQTLAVLLGVSGWRQGRQLQRRVKQLLRRINQACKSKQGGAARRRKRAYQPLLKLTRMLLGRARQLVPQAQVLAARDLAQSLLSSSLCQELEHYVALTEQALSQAHRRVVRGEQVPNAEKLFSIFEPHTELIHRGKTPQPVEFGHKVLVLEDTVGFVVHYEVLGKGVQDQDVGVSALATAQQAVGGKIRSASFDRGFHSPANQVRMAEIVAHPCLPMRGPKQEARQQGTATVEFRASRRHHPGVESAIHALQAGNGLSRCRDRTERGYERYVGLGVLGRNLHVLGKVVLGQETPGCQASRTKRQGLACSA